MLITNDYYYFFFFFFFRYSSLSSSSSSFFFLGVRYSNELALRTNTEVQDSVAGKKRNATGVRRRRHQHQYAARLHYISHILHYCSIGILGIFAFQVQTINGRSLCVVVEYAALRYVIDLFCAQ